MSSVHHVRQTTDRSPPVRTPPLRYYSRHTNIQPNRDSTIPPLSQENSNSSEACYSDERLIINAIRGSTSNEEPRPYENPYATCSILDRGLAANMARLIPPISSQDGQSSTQHRRPSKKRPRIDQGRWRNQLLSDQGTYYTSQLGPSPLNEAYYVPESAENQHRKAVSLDAVADHSPVGSRQHNCWPASSMPVAVTTNQPQYPPPERSPTPPGLPSFNTPEAVYCSAQFLIGHNGARAVPSNHPHGEIPSAQRSTSYTDAFRRFLGFQAPVETAPTVPSVIGIGRAPDGTVVQGRFPHRQSGHGTSLARQLDDHPFHNNALPTASISQASLDSFRTGLDFAPGTPSKGFGSVPRTGRRRGARAFALGLFGRTPTSAPAPVQRAQQEEATPGPISPLQLPQPRYDLVRTPSDRRPEDGMLSAGTYTLCDVLTWAPTRMYLCCCFSSSSVENNDDLEIITSRETYATARSRFSGLQDRLGPSP
ncbi:hypothetical protein N7454_009275 [Penicillium verhagenii]|nr:hypothetical protein N7454_009275 [Penicillium verhagenii]